MKELKGSTKAGQSVIARASFCEGYTLHDVYNSFSQAKDNAYHWCAMEFHDTKNAHDFHICSHNTFGFTVAWQGKINDENILRYETKDNSYLVWLDR